MVLGCVTVYQRETNMLNNQALLASEIVGFKSDSDRVKKQIGEYLSDFNARISALESVKSEPNKK